MRPAPARGRLASAAEVVKVARNSRRLVCFDSANGRTSVSPPLERAIWRPGPKVGPNFRSKLAGLPKLKEEFERRFAGTCSRDHFACVCASKSLGHQFFVCQRGGLGRAKAKLRAARRPKTGPISKRLNIIYLHQFQIKSSALFVRNS